jgi:hypothetical protein
MTGMTIMMTILIIIIVTTMMKNTLFKLEPITTHQIRTGRIGWPKLPIYNSPSVQYRRIDMDSIYSKELLREKKINSILGISDYYINQH